MLMPRSFCSTWEVRQRDAVIKIFQLLFGLRKIPLFHLELTNPQGCYELLAKLQPESMCIAFHFHVAVASTSLSIQQPFLAWDSVHLPVGIVGRPGGMTEQKPNYCDASLRNVKLHTRSFGFKLNCDAKMLFVGLQRESSSQTSWSFAVSVCSCPSSSSHPTRFALARWSTACRHRITQMSHDDTVAVKAAVMPCIDGCMMQAGNHIS